MSNERRGNRHAISLLLGVVACCALLLGCGSQAAQVTHAASATAATKVAVTSVHVHARPPRPANPCPPTSEASLPQTSTLPSAATACFRAEMRALWEGVRTNSLRSAMHAFFPLRAYEQVKAIADPSGDYQDRLVAEYGLDLAAANALLGPSAAGARLISVQVPSAFAHWVPPGSCYNGIGYYEVPNSRVVYRADGTVHSFGIASMISWRGIWYVVHLGAVNRPGPGGAVDDPSAGTGTPAPSDTC
jgi:hypothetical protein